MVKKDYAVYKLKKGNEIVYIGITDNIERRFFEYENSEKIFNCIDFVRGWYTRKEAEEKEYIEIMDFQNTHSNRLPKYNI